MCAGTESILLRMGQVRVQGTSLLACHKLSPPPFDAKRSACTTTFLLPSLPTLDVLEHLILPESARRQVLPMSCTSALGSTTEIFHTSQRILGRHLLQHKLRLTRS
ncbi:hypothetical protein K474DRAFT_1043085 [Panus rudis PR-1116 ss-1]|nr:hypothetical protein K474DRAFT_1043085 [Panus rudis PR-1116 ss-1]